MNNTFSAPNFAQNVNQPFVKTLQKRVSDYFAQQGISKHANQTMIVKTVVMLSLYFVPFICTFFTDSVYLYLVLWAVIGLGMAGIGFSVMHDANHGAYAPNSRWNSFIGLVLNLLGGNPTNWKIQHNVLHHTFTNVDGYDEDISPPVGALRFSPHSPWKPIHRFQHLYAWFFYSLMTLMWFFTKDFKQAIRYHKMGLLSTQGKTFKAHLTNILVGKILYATIFIGLPILFAQVFWLWAVVGFLISQLIAGLFLAIVFQPAHVIPDTSFTSTNDSGDLEADAKVHQLYTTANFSMKSRWFSWFVGGLNFQVEHHLFPNICHVHYRALSKIVKQTAEEFSLPYYSNRTFAAALKAHTKMLRMLGQKDCPDFVHI